MEEKKYIDRLYQEKFKDFEASPRRDLWKDIAEKLKEEEKKKPLIPFWWSRIAGVAAILTLVLLLGDWLRQPVTSTVVTSEDEIFSSQQPGDIELAATSDITEEKEKRGIATPELEMREPETRLDNLLAEISSLTASGIRKNISEENKASELKLEEGSKNLQPEKKSLSQEVLENQLKEENLIGSSKVGKIEVSTHAAPIYYGNLKSGNFIDQRFDGNNNGGEITYSYGVNVSYKLSEKLKIRSGVSKVTMSHNTNDIAFHAVLNPRSLEAVDYREDLGVRVVNGSITWKGSPEPIASAIKSSINNISRGLLNQKIGFIEVPVEVEYAIIDNRFSVNLIGGASTLFLDENSISISSGAIATELGQANNLNDVSFSTNIGLGLDYRISEKFKLNLEPMFKYQINTFDASTGTYQPYYIGVYSGFSYKF